MNKNEIFYSIVMLVKYERKFLDEAIETAKQFSVQKMVNEYFEVYESLINGL